MVSSLSVLLNLTLFISSLNSQTIFYSNGTAGPYKLTNNAIFINTDSVFINDTLINPINYSIDYNQGIISFNYILPESVKVIVRYKKLPFSTKDKYFHLAPQTITQNESTVREEKPTVIGEIGEQEENESNLEFSGSKTISVDLGSNQGMGLDQATRIDIKGTLQGVNISAMLSDVGNPIPPEGTTKELSEFDKILISLKTDKLSGSYGDNDLIQPIGNLGSVNKKVVGVLFNYHQGMNSTNLGYAKSKGKYKKLLFFGQDNIQGPYYLTKNMNNASIVPGSENVYLQGKRMIRGQNEDYTIDYSQGSITFTNRQIINSFSRIEIDFEYSTEDYNRYLWQARSQWQIINGLLLEGGVFSESDDKSQNLTYTLSNDDIEYLRTIGAESSQVWLSGEKYVGSGNGDYIKQANIFIYAGLDSGDYDVEFSYVGQGLGSYDYNNAISGFYYVGETLGKYVPKVHIQLPEQNRIYNANMKYESPVGINISLQGFFSQKYQNLFANTMQDKKGFSYLLNSSYDKEKFKLNYRRIESGSNFYFPGTYNSVDFNYYWAGIKQESLRNSDEIELKFKPINALIFNAGSGWIKSWDNNSRQRFFIGGEISPSADYRLANYNIEYYPNLLRRYSINLSPQYKILFPSVELFWEKALSSTQRYIIPSLQIKTSQSFDIKLGSDLKEFIGQNRKTNNIYKLESNFTKDNLNLNCAVGYQINKTNDIQENTNFFGNLSTQISIIQGLTTSVDYLEQQVETQTMEVNYVWVGSGLGNYKQNPETHQYYFDPKGDYVQELIPSGNFVASRTRNIQANWNFYRWQIINFDGYYSLNNQSTTQEQLQTINSRQMNLSILPYEKTLSIQVINTHNFSKDNLYNISSTQRKTQNNRIEINSQKIDNIPFRLGLELNHQINERINVGIEQERTEQIYTFKPTIGYGLNIITEISHNRAQISEPLYYPGLGSFWLYQWKIALERNWEIDKATNLSTNVSLSKRTATITQLPYDINLFEPIGITPEAKINLDRIIQSGLTGTFKQLILGGTYSFLKYPSRQAEHNFSMKLQANF